MPTGIENLASLGGTVVTVVIFIWYLIQKDKATKATNDAFNKTIQNHLAHALIVETQITKSLTSLTNCITDMSVKQTNRERTIDRRRVVEVTNK